ncbi:CRISPR-associated helicase/endonuclease Cas3 [Methanocella arvoryzae]|uniref:CRISPR-associated helicase n=1 Tax=Methanocella arvoryzae (strain DSM 22066 / NBRC 105507 / MRE50) TaxID=351160 RepID=Q0W588_METAR|nr:CRISPR-associated helicase/endonuclease Cas3 [Methanocella arvoryzae]CAJ36455.1 putative CRISPR-associated helicase [Methanocella arvoryzae MRE50]
MAEYEDLLKIWAKSDPFHPLLYHMIDAGNVALSLLQTPAFKVVGDKFSKATGCPREACDVWLAYLVAMHDIGKCDPNFQLLNDGYAAILREQGMPFPSEPDKKFRHERSSSEWVRGLLEEAEWTRRSRNTISNSILLHHSRSSDGELLSSPEIWDTIKRRLEEEIKRVFDYDNEPVDFSDNSEAGLLLSGLIVLSDWIASNEELMSCKGLECSVQDYALISRNCSERAITRLGFNVSVSWPENSSFSDVWPGGGFKELRPVQRACVDIFQSEIKPRLLIIEAPMGEGKTEAGIYSAVQLLKEYDLSGMYVALPTAATSNQMFQRFNAFLDMHQSDKTVKARLVHGMSWLVDDASSFAVKAENGDGSDSYEMIEWFKPSKRALIAPYSVGTIDQSLMSVLKVKFGFLRLFGLANKVLIIDEVHAYDAYMSTILKLLLQWCSCLQIPVIMLSATLPSEKKLELLEMYRTSSDEPGRFKPSMDYPLITIVNADGGIYEKLVPGSSKRVNIRVTKHEGYLGDYDLIASLAMERSVNGGCICIIMNTVKGAQSVYERIKNLSTGEHQVMLFHARFTAGRRDEIEKNALRLFDKRSLLEEFDPDYQARPKRAILVATQVVEQSLDLDFDEMITEIAPIDLLLQRAGRLHRHDRKNRPTGPVPQLHVLLPDGEKASFGSSEKVYERYVLLRTMDTLLERDLIEIPSDIKTLVETVYRPYTEEISSASKTSSSDDLAAAYSDMRKRLHESEGLASKYLIADPNPKEFTINTYSLEEDEAGTKSYFKASTRLGDDSLRVVVLNDGEYSGILASKSVPPVSVIREIMLKMVNIPRWWVNGYTPEQGYEPIQEGPAWLKGISILKTISGSWKGTDDSGNHAIIINDDELGLRFEKSSEKR